MTHYYKDQVLHVSHVIQFFTILFISECSIVGYLLISQNEYNLIYDIKNDSNLISSIVSLKPLYNVILYIIHLRMLTNNIIANLELIYKTTKNLCDAQVGV